MGRNQTLRRHEPMGEIRVPLWALPAAKLCTQGQFGGKGSCPRGMRSALDQSAKWEHGREKRRPVNLSDTDRLFRVYM